MTDKQKMRKEFEEWIQTCDGNHNDYDLIKYEDDHPLRVSDGVTYVNTSIEREFIVWQAGRASASNAQSDAPDERETKAWLINLNGHEKVHRHNPIADYKMIDPNATVTELVARYATIPKQPKQSPAVETTWESGNEYASSHPSASHVTPGCWGGRNDCYYAAPSAQTPQEREGS